MTTKRVSKAKSTTARKEAAASIVEEAITYQIGVRELRQDASRVLALVEAGATFTITNHGRTVGVLTPPQKSQLDKWIEEGKVTPAKRKIDLRNWKAKAGPASEDAWGAIERERAEARF
jgi:prevent-host-death family protein